VEALRRSRPHLKSLAVIGKEAQQASLIPSVDASVRKPLQADRTAGAWLKKAKDRRATPRSRLCRMVWKRVGAGAGRVPQAWNRGAI
jgi:hypothetical protein